MLSIIWGILKVIGIVLLVILALLLAILLAVLFVPLRYEFSSSGKYDKEAEKAPEYQVKAGVSWLLRLVSVRILAGGEGTQVRVRLFGIPLGGRKERRKEEPAEKSRKKEKRREKRAQTEKPAKGRRTRAEEWTERAEKPAEGQREPVEDGTGERQEQAEGSGWEEFPQDALLGTAEAEPKALEEEKEAEKKEEKKSPPQKLLAFLRKIRDLFRGFFRNLRSSFEKIRGKIRRIFDMAEEIREFLEAEENQEAFRYVKGEAGRLFRHVLPRKLSGAVRFGLEDPAATGKVLMALGIAYPLLGSRLSVTPVFENKFYVEGSLFFKGRIRAFSLLIIGIRVWFNKKFRGLLKRGRGLKEQLGRA